ncbi:Putative salt-induced outer membrane protein YdiY [Sphingopyxis sp. YR583]|uniref:DUF481 domain-containing protein n=1 Tax=Sphingopyxis sp. YR583 TaxID=1881047 RepID=UPI0008A7656F|nr:DUF481 domain-containing protein [Sphingopyxis sp. YR583]SEH13043.1 Putative salt-induced outer membrane protein YdiY [Sphingopyxis sp. YR583]
MLSIFVLAAAVPATSADLPPETRSLICAAASEGDLLLARSVAALASKRRPELSASAAALVEAIDKTGQCPPETAAPAVPTAPPAADLKGNLEFGLGQTSGPTDAANANIAASIESTDGRWTQKLRATLDYQDVEGIAASERYTAAWDAKRRLSKTAFLTALATFESDRFAGIRSRTMQSFGFGGKFPLADKLSLDLSGGPSWRQVDWFGERPRETQFGARGLAAFDWIVAPGFSVAASGSGVFEAASGTIEGQASITGKLIGPLATRLQFSARHETKPYPGIEPTTTTSRASLVYSF